MRTRLQWAGHVERMTDERQSFVSRASQETREAKAEMGGLC